MNDTSRTAEIDALIAQMTLAEKIAMCHSNAKFSSAGVPRLGIPPLVMSDGPHGVREEICADSWDPVGGDDDFATYLPTGSALAATWSRECARLFGEVLGAESRERRKDVILGPGLNIVRHPLCGRNFEYYSEDPWLNGELAVEAIGGIQEQGVAACVKHYALNSQELCRNSVNSMCDERTLREIYLRAFETAVKRGGALTVMGAYNLFNGQYCCQNDFLLNQILKKEWGFSGAVISDWGGVHDTMQAARGGMDIEMGSGEVWDEFYLGRPLREAVERGEFPEALLDEKVRRILHVMFAVGMIGGGTRRPAGERNSRKHQSAALRIAEEAAVLLKNRDGLLPLDRKRIKKLVVVGDNALRQHHYGGHSSAVKALYEISPVEGIRELLADCPEVQISCFRGYPASGGEAIPSSLMGLADAAAGTRGWRCDIYDNHARKSEPVCSLVLDQPAFDPEHDLPQSLRGGDFGAIIRGTLTPRRSEKWSFFLRGCSQAALILPDENWIENCKSQSDITGSVTVPLEAGRSYELSIPIFWHTNMPVYPVALTAAIGGASAGAADDELLSAAAAADAVIFCGGLNHTDDCEGTDRKDMALHDGQNELISTLAGLNRNLVVALVGGSPVEMPWIDRVPAVLQLWYGGMECGRAAARLLFGEANPSGKLPVTFPVRLEDSAPVVLDDYRSEYCQYREGLLVGYRWYDKGDREVLFAFGHGLSYSEFDLGDGRIDRFDRERLALHCSVRLDNRGDRDGFETVQLYLELPRGGEPGAPVRELRGFSKKFLRGNTGCRVDFVLDRTALEVFDPAARTWRVERGCYRIRFGRSSRELTAPLEFTL